MNFANLIKLALRAIMRNKTRSLLTMLGIIIGISAVITILSLGESVKNGMTSEFASMGTSSIIVRPARQRRGGVDIGKTTSKSLDDKDLEAIRKRCKHVAYISPSVTTATQMVVGSRNYSGTLTGVSPDELMIENHTLERGLMFTEQDVQTYAKVCVIGHTVAEELFEEGDNPIGQTIRMGKIPMMVVGVLKKKGQSSIASNPDDVVIAPYTTVQKRFMGINYFFMIGAAAQSQEVAEKAATEITHTLRETHNIGPEDEDDFEVMTMDEMMASANQIMTMLTLLLTAIAGISLVVGGIGIMNIMYVTVTERTREIGLRMAIGARGSDIMRQFLLESVVLSLIGGLIDIVLGIAMAFGLTAVIGSSGGDLPIKFVLSQTAIVASFLVCVAVGVFFGWYPARKAANLDPIQALRYE